MSADWPGERSRNGGVDEVPLPRGPGRLWLCGKHFIGPDHTGAVERVDADAVVCLCHRRELADRYPGYVAWLEAGGTGERRRRPTEVIWLPVDDLHAPGLEAAVELATSLRDRLDRGQSVLIHCGAGIGRAGTTAAAVLMAMGETRSSALATVAASRPLAGPEVGAQSDLLALLEPRLRGPGGPDVARRGQEG